MKHGQDTATFIATVGGLGRIPLAPGTWGSVVGVLLGVLGARVCSVPVSLLILAVTFVVCAMVSTEAERVLGVHDPSAVIIDEVWAMAAILMLFPSTTQSRWHVVIAFVLFRLFDVVKPPPLQRLARLPGGWGIMADDFGAAAYALLVLLLLVRLLPS